MENSPSYIPKMGENNEFDSKSAPPKETPPKRGRKTGAARKLSRKVSKIFLKLFDFFLALFALCEKCRKVSKIFVTLFDDFDVF